MTDAEILFDVIVWHPSKEEIVTVTKLLMNDEDTMWCRLIL